MITRIFNVMLAGGIALLTLPALFMAGDQLTWTDFFYPLTVFCWLASAIGLFFRSRLAWLGSLLGVGAMLANSITISYTGRLLLPSATDPTDGIGYMLVAGSIGIALSLPLLIGLICIRKSIFTPGFNQPSADR